MLQLSSNRNRTMATDSTVCSANGTLYRAPNRLNLFDTINLARCAAERAKANVWDSARWDGEYTTALIWHHKQPNPVSW